MITNDSGQRLAPGTARASELPVMTLTVITAAVHSSVTVMAPP
jgi:hypothetical protein